MTGPQKRELQVLTTQFNSIGLDARGLSRKSHLETISRTETEALAYQLQRGLSRHATKL